MTQTKFLGFATDAVYFNGTGLVKASANSKVNTTLALFEIKQDNDNEAKATVGTMQKAANGEISESKQLPFEPDSRTQLALSLYAVVEKALKDGKIDPMEGLTILATAAGSKEGKKVLKTGLGGLIGNLSGLLSGGE